MYSTVTSVTCILLAHTMYSEVYEAYMVALISEGDSMNPTIEEATKDHGRQEVVTIPHERCVEIWMEAIEAFVAKKTSLGVAELMKQVDANPAVPLKERGMARRRVGFGNAYSKVYTNLWMNKKETIERQYRVAQFKTKHPAPPQF